ncbi:MAG: GNAT family N-acetyltransferase [Lachnospiraceae bacterium]|nr:GNAT family N-acetyltransferase [Lachnospiraceae bacterium]
MDITIVRNENQEAFENLMPSMFWEKADFVLGAVDENTACGIIAVCEEDTLFNIQYIFVAEEFRRRGIATALIEGIHLMAKECKIDVTYCQYAENADTESLTNCFKKNLFDRDENSSHIYKVLFKDLSVKLLDGKSRMPEDDIWPLAEVTSVVWKSFTYKLNQLAEEDTIPEIEKKANYDQDASFLLMHKGEPVGCILLKKYEESYILSCFCVFGNVSPMEKMRLFQASYQIMKERCSQDTEITVNALTETTKKMVLSLTDGKAKQVGIAATWHYAY